MDRYDKIGMRKGRWKFSSLQKEKRIEMPVVERKEGSAEMVLEEFVEWEPEETSTEDASRYKESTYGIVSKVAYLIGVPLRVFENEYEAPQMSVYYELHKDKSARIIRNLCIVRNSIERAYKRIDDMMRHENRTLLAMNEYVPQDSMAQLTEDGIQFIKGSSRKLTDHIIEINRLISDRINNCKQLFPLWLNWQYVKELFVMPNGLTEQGTKDAATLFYSNLDLYPYKMYINWKPQEMGNILYNDKKFVTILYEMHHAVFTEFSKVSDVGAAVKDTIYDFIDESEKIVVVVDCENSDAYKLSAVIRNLDYESTNKISKIILFDDVHTSTAWGHLEDLFSIPVEYMMVERVKGNKSLVDIRLTARACIEHLVNKVDSFILVSSDSDYWGLISELSDARFLVMVERGQTSQDLKNALIHAGIFYCYIDDFYSGNIEDVKQIALYAEMHRYLDNAVRLNVNTMFETALTNTRIEMSSAEKKRFYEEHIKTMNFTIDSDGTLTVSFKK